MKSPFIFALIFSMGIHLNPTVAQTSNPTSAGRIGVYDSRVVAFAHFWSEDNQTQLRENAKRAEAAATTGDRDREEKLKDLLKAQQDRIHLQVFSTAPIDEILSGMTNRLAEIQAQKNIRRFVSKWDDDSLKAENGEKIDVTDNLVQGFNLDKKRLKIMQSIKTQKPLSLEKAKELMNKGKL
jgi:hypothetical protein